MREKEGSGTEVLLKRSSGLNVLPRELGREKGSGSTDAKLCTQTTLFCGSVGHLEATPSPTVTIALWPSTSATVRNWWGLNMVVTHGNI